MHGVFLLLGSNLGDRRKFIADAVEHIASSVGEIEKVSSLYETQAWGKTDEADYLNQVVLVRSVLEPHAVLEKILGIEAEAGRLRAEKWGARTLDIDILFYDDRIVDEPDLKIPHPELHKRRFTLEPLAEIAPGLVHPFLKENILAIKNQLNDDLIVKKL